MKILILCCDGIELYELSSFIDIFGWSNSVLSTKTITVLAGCENIVECSFNKKIVPDVLIENIDPSEYDALIIPGGFKGYGYFNDKFIKCIKDIVNSFYTNRKPIATTCVASILLNDCLEESIELTTYPYENEKWIKELSKGNNKFINNKIVMYNNVITSQGPGCSVECALKLLEVLTNREVVNQIKHVMQFD